MRPREEIKKEVLNDFREQTIAKITMNELMLDLLKEQYKASLKSNSKVITQQQTDNKKAVQDREANEVDLIRDLEAVEALLKEMEEE